MNTMNNAKLMTVAEYSDYQEEYVTNRMCEMHWEGGLDAEQVFEMVVDWAMRDGITLTDMDEFDFETFYYDWYESIDDKGAS